MDYEKKSYEKEKKEIEDLYKKEAELISYINENCKASEIGEMEDLDNYSIPNDCSIKRKELKRIKIEIETKEKNFNLWKNVKNRCI